jgi:hypothetical protein
LLWRLLRSPWGKAFTALRDNPIRAESLGVNIRNYTLLSFAIGAVYAGVAGRCSQPGGVHRAGALQRGGLDHDVPDGGGRRGRLLLRPAARRGRRRAAARVAALRPGLVPVRVRPAVVR